ncbi:hypothetical protein AGR3A_Cc280048 [Agrobacterium tomkonis CFBP 6623]|uniref:Uncharacterized protein n=1 Tax=Agrobacterium tomkonis CFBP 6623 TaxID=1183432 RepID=A0A1S7PQ33_9HYPH|nr:hypothetical protein AGR3A_Cc280048 [Agrobacterium tomkonis CFBP 6623]
MITLRNGQVAAGRRSPDGGLWPDTASAMVRSDCVTLPAPALIASGGDLPECLFHASLFSSICSLARPENTAGTLVRHTTTQHRLAKHSIRLK